MTTPLPDEQLADIEARKDAATEGPWGVYQFGGDSLIEIAADLEDTGCGYRARRTICRFDEEPLDNDPAHREWTAEEDWAQVQADAEFAAHAREDVDALTAEVRRLRARALTASEYNAAWHAVEGAAGEEGADPGTILHAVLDRLGIAWQDAARPAAAVETAPSAEELADATDATRLRWGLNDIEYGDDDTITVMLSGPDREPYWLELDQERAAVLRANLAGPDGDDDAEEVESGNGSCGHDDYHDPHEWADRPGIWCPGIGYDDEAAAPTAETGEACGKCKQPFDSADPSRTGRARFYLTPYCRRCVDLCHDNEIADHRCVICA